MTCRLSTVFRYFFRTLLLIELPTHMNLGKQGIYAEFYLVQPFCIANARCPENAPVLLFFFQAILFFLLVVFFACHQIPCLFECYLCQHLLHLNQQSKTL